MSTYTIIPGLVSLETTLDSVANSYLVGDLKFFKKRKEEKFHYILIKDNGIQTPESYDFRNDYFFKKGSVWTYSRSILGAKFKFQYNTETKTLLYNEPIRRLPFTLGGVVPLGSHLSDIMTMDLHIGGFTHLRGCSFLLNGRVHAISAPGFSGKTTTLRKAVEEGGRYIAEDSLIINFSRGLIYPTNPTNLSRMFGRSTNEVLKNKLQRAEPITQRQKLEKLILLQNSTSDYTPRGKDIIDYVSLNGLYFYHNLFTRSLLFEDNYSKLVLSERERFNGPITVEHKPIQNYKLGLP